MGEQITNAYIPYTQEVVDAAEQFMTYFALAKLKAMDAAPAVVAVEAAPAAAVVVEAAPAVAAVKSAPVAEAVKPALAAVVPTFYRMPAVHGYPAFTYPVLPMNYFLMPFPAPVAAAAAAPVAVATPEAVAETAPVVEVA